VKGYIYILFTGLLSLTFGCKSQLSDRVIKFTVTETSDYCGGAAPNEEVMQSLLTKKPFTGTLYVHSMPERMDEGQALQIQDGTLKQSGFSEGVYFIYTQPKLNRSDSSTMKLDEDLVNCLEMFSLHQTANFIVSKETKSVTFNVHTMCDPCAPPNP
jgi:hypothetical protein